MKFLLTIVFVLFSLLGDASSTRSDRGSSDLSESSRVYCVQIGRVNKRDVRSGELHFHGEIRPVTCRSGFEFCTTSIDCCCEIPPSNGTNKGIFVLAAVMVFLVLLLFCVLGTCGRRRQWASRYNHGQSTTVVGHVVPGSTINTYESKHLPPPPSVIFNNRADMAGEEGASVDSFDFGKGKAGLPLSISGSIPPPPYSEHSFAVLPASKDGVGTKGSSLYTYSKRPTRAHSVASWLKTQDGDSRSQRSTGFRPASTRSSVARNSNYSRSGRAGAGRSRNEDLLTIPSMRSGSTKAASEVIYDVRNPASTIAASEVIYEGVPSMASRSHRGSRAASTVRNDDAISHGDTRASVVSYNPNTGVAGTQE